MILLSTIWVAIGESPDQYIKDCEAGAGRTPSVRRRK